VKLILLLLQWRQIRQGVTAGGHTGVASGAGAAIAAAAIAAAHAVCAQAARAPRVHQRCSVVDRVFPHGRRSREFALFGVFTAVAPRIERGSRSGSGSGSGGSGSFRHLGAALVPHRLDNLTSRSFRGYRGFRPICDRRRPRPRPCPWPHSDPRLRSEFELLGHQRLLSMLDLLLLLLLHLRPRLGLHRHLVMLLLKLKLLLLLLTQKILPLLL
jgi:hypothetical protein